MLRTVFLAAAIILATTAIGADPGKPFVNSKFGYRIIVPAKWDMDFPSSGVPVLFNYKRSQGGPQGLFPEHGAHIFIIPLSAVRPHTQAETVDDWIRENLRRDHEGSSIRRAPEMDQGENGPRNVVEVEADFIRDEQDGEHQREINYYFTLNEMAFRMRLLYWKDDPEGKYFQSIARELLRGLMSSRQ